jgi:hypothetical protein
MSTETPGPAAEAAPVSTPTPAKRIQTLPTIPPHIHPKPPKPIYRRFWDALKTISLLVSMGVNLILIIIVAILLNQIGAIKTTVASILGQLDSAFLGLGQATIVDTIKIDQRVPVQFDLPLNQDTTVVTMAPVPIVAPTTFSLGPYGTINGTVSLALPAGTQLPVHLQMTVPVSNAIPVVFDQPVSIPLAQKGLGPVVAKLRSALGPLIQVVQQLPDAFIIFP